MTLFSKCSITFALIEGRWGRWEEYWRMGRSLQCLGFPPWCHTCPSWLHLQRCRIILSRLAFHSFSLAWRFRCRIWVGCRNARHHRWRRAWPSSAWERWRALRRRRNIWRQVDAFVARNWSLKLSFASNPLDT